MEVIEWLDHCSGGDAWHNIGEATELTPSLAISVGFVIAETDSHLVVVPHASDDDVFGDLAILKSTIVRREILKAVS